MARRRFSGYQPSTDVGRYAKTWKIVLPHEGPAPPRADLTLGRPGGAADLQRMPRRSRQRTLNQLTSIRIGWTLRRTPPQGCAFHCTSSATPDRLLAAVCAHL